MSIDFQTSLFCMQLVVLVSQIRVNSMAVVHMQSQHSYGALEQPGKVLLFKDYLTSDIVQVGIL